MSVSPNVISVRHLNKEFQVHKRASGLGAALRSLLHRTYETKHAVSDLSFEIAQGERVGFLGPNGAGKTTTLKMLSGLLHPTSGDVLVAGHQPLSRETAFLKKITLVMGQKQQLLWDLPPMDTFTLNRAVYDIPQKIFVETLEELMGLLQIADVVRTPTRQLSLGERMKCELCAALLHRPRILFLDEPTIGLDVSMQVTLRRFILSYNERFGATVLLTSHYMEDVVALCPRILVIDHGRLRYDGNLTELVRSVRPDKQVTLRLAQCLEGGEEALGVELAKVGKVVRISGTQAVVQMDKDRLREAVSHLLGTLPIVDLSMEDPPLEEVLRDLFESAR